MPSGKNQSALRSFAQALHWSLHHRLFMLTAYIDESSNGKIYVLAGLVAPVRVWVSVEKQWQREIDLFRVGRFHAVDCAHSREEFEGLGKAERAALVRKLIHIVTHVRPQSSRARKGIFGLSFATKLDDYNAVMGGAGKALFPDPYMLMFQFIVRDVAFRCGQLAEREAVDIIMDRNDEFVGQATELFRRLVNDEETAGRDLLKGISFQNSKDFPGLQAADLFAYETMKLLDRNFYAPEREVRKAMRAFVKIPCEGGFIGKPGLRRLLSHFGISTTVQGD